MSKIFYDENGKPFPLPVGREDGKKHRKTKYIDPENKCPVCRHFIYYTKNGRCVRCAADDACDLHAYAVGAMVFGSKHGRPVTQYPKDPRLSGPIGNREIEPAFKTEIESIYTMLPRPVSFSRQQAMENKVKLWLRAEPCSRAGHFGVRTLKGDCYFCEQEKGRPSPRQEAIKNSKSWYIPRDPCPKCGKHAERSVHNGSCRGCPESSGTAASDGRGTPETIMMKNEPGMILPVKQARALGLKVYRTGRPCRKGHRGFRYVSTGSCIECLRGF